MKKRMLLVICLAVMMVLPVFASARDIPLFVSADWLDQNLKNPKVRILDIRKVEAFKEGHVPGAVNLFYGAWVMKKGDLRNEFPNPDDLGDLIAGAGVAGDSWVVVVGNAGNVSDLTELTRVAVTLKYAGIGNVAILDGGYDKWLKEKKPVSQEVQKPASTDFKPKWNAKMLVDKKYVMGALKKATVVDARGPDAFFGVMKLDFVDKAGHIAGATSLPSVWVFTKDGTVKTKEDLDAMAQGVVGKNKAKEVIVYCDTGKVCTVWWLVLSEMLGYKKVKNYEGSMEEWTKDPKAPVKKYSWR
jgi:thiosulfate/3-mercaptopyruvate sulfurtransferase